jgi:hypothetical protein
MKGKAVRSLAIVGVLLAAAGPAVLGAGRAGASTAGTINVKYTLVSPNFSYEVATSTCTPTYPVTITAGVIVSAITLPCGNMSLAKYIDPPFSMVASPDQIYVTGTSLVVTTSVGFVYTFGTGHVCTQTFNSPGSLAGTRHGDGRYSATVTTKGNTTFSPSTTGYCGSMQSLYTSTTTSVTVTIDLTS